MTSNEKVNKYMMEAVTASGDSEVKAGAAMQRQRGQSNSTEDLEQSKPRNQVRPNEYMEVATIKQAAHRTHTGLTPINVRLSDNNATKQYTILETKQTKLLKR